MRRQTLSVREWETEKNIVRKQVSKYSNRKWNEFFDTYRLGKKK